MPSRYLNPEAPQSGLDALLSGFGQAYTGVKDERRKRQEEAQKDALLKQQMRVADQQNQRANAEAGMTEVTFDPVTIPHTPLEAGAGVRAKIGNILSRVFGAEQTIQPTGTLVKTGPSQQERITQIGEEGANSRNAATIAGEDRRSTAQIASTDSRSAIEQAENIRWHDLEHQDRQAQIAAMRDAQNRQDRREDNRDLRDYGRQLNEEIASLQRMAADKNGIMQQVGGSGDPVAAYQQRQREIRSRISELHGQLNDVNAQMSRKAIGQKLAGPKAPAGIPSRQPTLEEDLQAAMRPGTR